MATSNPNSPACRPIDRTYRDTVTAHTDEPDSRTNVRRDHSSCNA
jgi:hypothetical protein